MCVCNTLCKHNVLAAIVILVVAYTKIFSLLHVWSILCFVDVKIHSTWKKPVVCTLRWEKEVQKPPNRRWYFVKLFFYLSSEFDDFSIKVWLTKAYQDYIQLNWSVWQWFSLIRTQFIIQSLCSFFEGSFKKKKSLPTTTLSTKGI